MDAACWERKHGVGVGVSRGYVEGEGGEVRSGNLALFSRGARTSCTELSSKAFSRLPDRWRVHATKETPFTA